MGYKVTVVDKTAYDYIIGNISKLNEEIVTSYKKSLFDLGAVSDEYIDLITTQRGIDKQIHNGAGSKSNAVFVYFAKLEDNKIVVSSCAVEVVVSVNMNDLDRSDFANNCCESLYRLYNGDFENALFIKEIKLLQKQFKEHVRNVYELTDEIPLFEYINFLQAEHRDDFHSREFEEILSGDSITWKEDILQLIVEKCKSLYDNKRIEIQ